MCDAETSRIELVKSLQTVDAPATDDQLSIVEDTWIPQLKSRANGGHLFFESKLNVLKSSVSFAACYIETILLCLNVYVY